MSAFSDFDWSPPTLYFLRSSTTNQLKSRRIAGKEFWFSDRFSDYAVQRLDRIRGIDAVAGFRRIVKQRDQVRPVAAPHHADGRALLIPLLPERLEPSFGLLGLGRTTNAIEIRSDELAIFSGDEIQAVAHHVHDAALELHLCVKGLDCLR